MSENLRLNLEALFQRYPALRRRSDEFQRDSNRSVNHSGANIRRAGSKGPGVYLIEGLQSGEALKWAEANATHKDSVVLVVEKDVQAFVHLASDRSLKAVIEDTRYHFVIGGGVQDFASQMMVPFHHKRRAALLSNLTIIRDGSVNDPDFYDACELQLDNCIQLFGSMSGHRADGLTGLKYFVQNIPWIECHPGIDKLEKLFSGASGIVASTGPSLSKSLPRLKELQDSHIIIAADASLKILLNAGIQPHFVCTMEREMASKPFFEGISSSQAKTHLVSFPEVPYDVISAYPGPQWVAYRKQLSHLYFQQQVPRGMLGSGHSVAHMCMQLASWLGCARLALVGQDLAFDPDSLSSHAENVAYAQWSKASSQEDLKQRLEKEGDSLAWVAGNLREKVPTRGYYIVFAWEFGAQANLLNLEVTNCTEGGMKIPQIPWMSFSEWSGESKATGQIFSQIETARIIDNQKHIDSALLAKSVQNWSQKLRNQSQVISGLLSSTPAIFNDASSSVFFDGARKLLNEIREDHVVEAFAFDILGRELVPYEAKLLQLEERSEWMPEDWKLLSEYFGLLSSSLDDVRTVLTQKVK